MDPKITIELNQYLKQQIESHLLNAGFSLDAVPNELMQAINQAYASHFKQLNEINRCVDVKAENLIKSEIALNAELNLSSSELRETQDKLLNEINYRKEKEESIRKTERLLVSFNQAAEILLSSETEESSLCHAFGIIGEKNKFDIVFISQTIVRTNQDVSFSNPVHWKRNENDAWFENEHKSFLKQLFNHFEKQVKSGETIAVDALELRDIFKHLPDQKQIGSILFQPIFVKGVFWGIAGIINNLEEHNWNNSQKNILQSFMHSVASFIERRKVDAEIKATQQELLIAQNIAKIGSFEIDFIKQRSSFSEQAARLLGFKKEELTFQDKLITKLRTNVLPDDLKQIDHEWAKAVENLTDLNIDFRVKLSDKKIYYLNWFLKNTFSRNGTLVKVNGTLQDVSEKRKMK